MSAVEDSDMSQSSPESDVRDMSQPIPEVHDDGIVRLGDLSWHFDEMTRFVMHDSEDCPQCDGFGNHYSNSYNENESFDEARLDQEDAITNSLGSTLSELSALRKEWQSLDGILEQQIQEARINLEEMTRETNSCSQEIERLEEELEKVRKDTARTRRTAPRVDTLYDGDSNIEIISPPS